MIRILLFLYFFFLSFFVRSNTRADFYLSARGNDKIIESKPLVLPSFFRSIAITTITATGTGQTTGHIANLHVKNSGDQAISIKTHQYYIPSSGQYQPYIARIPANSIPPGVTATIPVEGYCIDIHKPPVPSGESMPPVSEWIPVGEPLHTSPDPSKPLTPTTTTSVPLNDKKPLDRFTPASIPGITSTPGFIPQPGKKTSVTITWPGTQTPVGGSFDDKTKPEIVAPVFVAVLEAIEKASTVILENPDYETPFSPDKKQESTSVIQQTFWIYCSVLDDKEYTKPDFAERVNAQFQEKTGQAITTLPEEQKKQLEKGIDQFWSVFTATGVEAKVLSKPEKTEPPIITISANICTLEKSVKDSGPKLDYDIAETGTKERNEKVRDAFKKAIEEAAGIVSNSKGSDTIDVEFTTPEMPASAWSLYFPHVVAGRANATAMAIDLKNPLQSAWTTKPIQTKSDGNHTVVLTHNIGKNCKSTLIGVNFAKLRAASGLEATMGNIEAVRVINFIGEVAIDILIKKGKGTFKKLGKYLKEKVKDMAEDKAKEYIKEEMKKLAKELEGKTEKEAEETMDELIEKMKSGKADEEDEAEDAEDELFETLTDILMEGSEYDPAEKLEEATIDKVDSPIDWAPVKTNTYAIAEGSLEIWVDDQKGLAKTGSGVRYKRKGLEDKEETEKGGGVFCKEATVSDVTSGSITVKTIGNVATYAGATGEGIFNTGHGIASATLESFNCIYIVAICECPEGIFYDTYKSFTGFSRESIMTDIWLNVFERNMEDVIKDMEKDIEDTVKKAGKNLPENYASDLQKKMKAAAAKSSRSILPCEETKK